MQSKKIIESHTVPPLEQPIRLSDYLRHQFLSIPSRKGMKKALDKNRVLVDGLMAQTATRIRGGETIGLLEENSKKKVFEKKLDILFEDDYLAVINKPTGMLVSGNAFKTVEQTLPFNLCKSPRIDALNWPQAIHRLDYGTSGALLVGKTRTSVTRLNRMFEDILVKKSYRAWCCGKPEQSGTITSEIDGKYAKTTFEVLNELHHHKYLIICDLLINTHTGRRHQIRKHFAEIDHPLLGDVTYGGMAARGIYLHAYEIEFSHPFTLQNIKLRCELPQKFRRVMEGSKA